MVLMVMESTNLTDTEKSLIKYNFLILHLLEMDFQLKHGDDAPHYDIIKYVYLAI